VFSSPEWISTNARQANHEELMAVVVASPVKMETNQEGLKAMDLEAKPE
jgi:hypothetical protein